MAYEDVPCQDIVVLVTDYLEGALPEDRAAAVERHLVMCDGCAVYLEQMRETIRITGSLREEDVPDELMGVLLDAFRDRHTSG